MELSKFWTYIEKRLGLFLVANKLKAEYDKESCKLFKLFCLTPDSKDPLYKIESALNNHMQLKDMIGKETKRFLNENVSWDYEDIYRYISEFEKAGELYIGTPFELIDEILDKIFTEDYVNKLIENYFETGHLPNILDPACGRGRFLFKIKERLMKSGFDEKEIIEHLYGIDIDPKSVYLTQALIDPKGLCEKSNIYLADTLNDFPEELKDMKFDIVIGNPPYQDGNSNEEANKLWPKFIKIGMDILNDGGILSMITPQSWMLPTADVGKGKSGIHIFKDVFQPNNLIFANINSDDIKNKYFPKVGSTFSWYICKKESYKGSTILVTHTGIQNVSISGLHGLPKICSSESISINKKMVSHDSVFEFIDQNHNLNGNEQEQQDDIYKYRCFHTHGNGVTWRYGDHENPYIKTPKVLITMSGKYEAVYNYEDGFSNMCVALVLNTEKEALNAVSLFNSSLYRFYIDSNKFSGFNPRKIIIAHFPKLDLTRSWTDQKIYGYFNLTKEEIELIEESVK